VTAPSVEGRGTRADCVADATGEVAFDMPGSAAGAALLLRRRGGAAPEDTVRLPLVPTGDGRRRAVLSSTVALAEGHWDAYTDEGAAVAPGLRDLRALIDRVPRPGRVVARVPYPTADGRLALRAWSREPHAEAGGIDFEPAACLVGGVLYGAELGPGAVAEARLAGTVHRFAVTGGGSPGGGTPGAGRSFAFTIPYDTLAGGGVTEQRMWALWLRPAEDAEPVRVSRVLDDVWDRRNVYVYPVHASAAYRATPCYTSDNDLCVRLNAP
jgi:hypothetical protein